MICVLGIKSPAHNVHWVQDLQHYTLGIVTCEMSGGHQVLITLYCIRSMVVASLGIRALCIRCDLQGHRRDYNTVDSRFEDDCSENNRITSFQLIILSIATVDFWY